MVGRGPDRHAVPALNWRNLCLLVIGVTLVWASMIVMSTKSNAAEPGPDCAWVGTQQHGAQTCRDRGWVLTDWLAVNPHGVVSARNYLPPCTFNDADGGPLPCSVDFGAHDQRELAYWVSTNRTLHYVWARRPAPIREGYAHWATRADQKRLDLSRKCWVYRTKQHTWNTQCPSDGAPAI